MNKQVHSINTDFYGISNRGQWYDLHIPRNTTTQTFNIHFGEQLYRDVTAVFQKKHRMLLAHGNDVDALNFEVLPKLYWKSPGFYRKK